MDTLTNEIITARQAHSAAKLHYNEVKEQLDLIEASLFLECDYKGLGSNEAIRKAAFAVNVLAKDARAVQLKGALAKAEQVKENTWVTLENLLEQRRDYENRIRAEFLHQRYNVIVTTNGSCDDFGDFEQSVMAEEYFNE